jgi:hypothetical protein
VSERDVLANRPFSLANHPERACVAL